MSCTVVRDLPEPEDKTLVLVLDGENNLTAHPKTLDRVIEKKKPVDVKIIRLLATTPRDDDFDRDPNDTRPRVNIMVEEILPEMSDDEDEEGKASSSAAPPDFVDPLSQLDTDAMAKLKNALASDQAKQLLGDNVTAMLDVLSVEDPAAFIRNTIRRDHCYTQLSPSSDPSAASARERTIMAPDMNKPSTSGSSNLKKSQPRSEDDDIDPEDSDEKAEQSGDESMESGSSDRSSDSDYFDRNTGFRRDRRRGRRGGRVSTPAKRGRGRPRKQRDRTPEPEPMDDSTEQLQTVIIATPTPKRGRPRKDASSVVTVQVPVVVEPTPVDNAAAKVLSADAIRLGRSVKSDVERKRDMARILEKLGDSGRKVLQNPPAVPSQVVTVAPAALSNMPVSIHDDAITEVIATLQGGSEEVVQPEKVEKKIIRAYIRKEKPASPDKKQESPNVMGGKYPRRENRKLPSHLADAQLFTSPDILRRKTNQSVQQEIKNPPKVIVKAKPVEPVPVPAPKEPPPAPKVVTPPTAKSLADDTLTELESMLEEGLADSPPKTIETVTPKPAGVARTRSSDRTRNEPSLKDKAGVLNSPEIITESTVEVVVPARTSQRTRSSSEMQMGQGEIVHGPEEGEVGEVEDRRRSAAKRRRSDEVSDLDLDSDEDDALSVGSQNSEDDPDKLWCICRKPHNNRFMICCDVCEEWFHGKCVGITKSIGKQMEQDGLEWSCPTCSKKKRAEEREKELKIQAAKFPKPQDTKPTVQTKLPATFGAKPADFRKCYMCNAAVRENSIYCSDECIRKHSQGAIAKLSTPQVVTPSNVRVVAPKKEERRVVVIDPANRKVLTGLAAPTLGNLGPWLQQHPNFCVYFKKKPQPGTGGPITMRKVTKIERVPPSNFLAQQTPGKVYVRNAPGVTIVKKAGAQQQLTVSPNSKRIRIFRTDGLVNASPPAGLVRKPNIEIVSPRPKLPESPKVIRREPPVIKKKRKEKHETLQEYRSPLNKEKMEEKSGGPADLAIRENVKKTLGDALRGRLTEDKDLDVKAEEIDEMAEKIEDRLFKHFDNKVDVKYKSKFRSLVFNIKDTKNETLYKKILDKSISARELVKLSAEELASQELAQWRQKENQHQLEMIKKTELELLTKGQTFLVKSHKGEEFIEGATKKAAVSVEIDPNTSAKELVSALNSVTSTTPDNEEIEEPRSSETGLMKMKKKEERDRRHEQERRHKSSSDRSSRSRHSKKRKRSRSRSRDRRHHSRDRKSRSSRHSRDQEKRTKHDDKKEESKPSTSKKPEPEPESLPVKEPLMSDEADYEPTSTVSINTPELSQEEPEESQDEVEPPPSPEPSPPPAPAVPDWQGEVLMSEVSKFTGHVFSAKGQDVADDIVGNIFIHGRINYPIVWDYLAKLKEAVGKEIILVQIMPATEEDRGAYLTLFHYLHKRSRIGVVKGAGGRVKDFYIYPHNMDALSPAVLGRITLPLITEEKYVLLGIMVRNKTGMKAPPPRQKILPLPSRSKAETQLKLPLPEDPLPGVKSKRAAKRSPPIVPEEEEEIEGGDSPYEPGSDDDLPPLAKIAKKPPPEEYTPQSVVKSTDEDKLQKQIDEMNRAIEEKTQQIQSLASTVPLLPVIAPVLQKILPSSTAVPPLDIALKALQTIEKGLVASSAVVTAESPSAPEPIPSATSQSKSEVSAGDAPSLLLPEIAIPANLHEILASIQNAAPSAETAVPVVDSPALEAPDPPLIPPIGDTAPQKKKLERTDVFESEGMEVKSLTSKKSKIKFDLRPKERDIDERLVAGDIDERVVRNTGIQPVVKILTKDSDERRVEPLPTMDQDDRLLPRIISDPDVIPLPTSSSSKQDDRPRRSARRGSDADRRRRSSKDKLEGEWEDSIRAFEEDQRRRNDIIREKEIERLKRMSDSE